MPDLSRLLTPHSIAVIGASDSPEKVGAIALKNIQDSGFPGAIFPVNPKLDTINGLKCYPDVLSIPIAVDLAVIAVPSTIAIQVLSQLGEKSIKNAVIFTAGFKEAGPDGIALENELKQIAKKFEINVVGPNCLGFLNNEIPLHVTFGQIVKQNGNLRIVSQSGAIATSLFDWCKKTNLGFNQFITVGNKAVLSEDDFLKEWKNKTPDLKGDTEGLSNCFPIGLYLESITNGKEFVKVAEEISVSNPIFILKPGKSEGAVRAMRSHTGAIAGEDSVLEVALKQAGVIRCHDLSEFFDLSRALSWENAPHGPRVAVISNAGGPAVLSTDSISEFGLELAEFSPATAEHLAEKLPRMAGLHNPIDVLGDALADRFGSALNIVLQEDSVDAVVVILTPQLMTQIEKTAQIIGNLSKQFSKPVLCSFIGGGVTEPGEQVLNKFRIPSFPFPERAIRALASMWSWQSWRNQHVPKQDDGHIHSLSNIPLIKNIFKSVMDDNRKTLDGFEASHVMISSGIKVPETHIVPNIEKAKAFVDKVGWPVVLKISSPALLHKSDVGGVIAHIHNHEKLNSSINELTFKVKGLDKEMQYRAGLLIQKEVIGGIEVIVGIKRDPSFGPVVLFGAGGKMAELILDRNLRLLPIDQLEASFLIKQSKIFKLLNGFRGDKPYDISGLSVLILKLATLVENFPEISEIEINPVIVTHDDVWAVDAKVILN